MRDGQAGVAVNGHRPGAKAVIINGDDLGLSAEVNAGILRAHREGILNSASLMVAEAARDDAARAAKEFPGLDVGLHLVVCRGRSVLPPSEIAPIVDGEGRFADNPVASGLNYFFNRSIHAKLTAECRAQIETHLKLVGYLNHIDGHLNFHVHPALADIMLELAAEYKVPCIRLPREPAFTTLAIARDHMARKLVESVIFRSLSRRTRKKAARKGIRSTDWVFGLHQSGHLTEKYLLGIISRLRPGLTEIYFHPAMDVGGTPPDANAQREVEILTSPRVREALSSRAIAMTTFAELARVQDNNG
jgi:hopanoid biosynthesis associated protein HpnK